ncbi:hypothetical protein MA5S0422_3009 [Mycobacteroides abscessus 5S-0422]|uniref:Uncharacterized protein n=1 Tax=Mycobacteroides abscessus subsp. bolletii 1513 TaxID=1299321 RepID=X8DRJ2_9MYCO|nr:hypothetical protein [Mycobacteroides abscessus]EUA70666.1 hypothetical protein I540_3242 [Mycobacteroides abscessus subsp. bolletii 1513]EIU08603.1 hypothetical protein MA5S0304_2074 [Mycobacteroides abscessus 5S-0304]EIU12758.1 hypothetical protein MA5S0421_2329 [Mycobacteroides abscessus 5S-0421]EIU13656.1 hypothetical protein MA5S0422_3009 [Mycobacteroides abscessus 5S-0422]EIU21135.1 hypothetical protein MA5S0708_5097 [Mycobacteroides abscessus 5S-0708]
MDSDKEARHIDELRESAKNRILNFPLNVVEYNRADHMHKFLRDSAILAQTEALLAISEELALIRKQWPTRPQGAPPNEPAPRTPPPGGTASASGTQSGQRWQM